MAATATWESSRGNLTKGKHSQRSGSIAVAIATHRRNDHSLAQATVFNDLNGDLTTSHRQGLTSATREPAAPLVESQDSGEQQRAGEPGLEIGRTKGGFGGFRIIHTELITQPDVARLLLIPHQGDDRNPPAGLFLGRLMAMEAIA